MGKEMDKEMGKEMSKEMDKEIRQNLGNHRRRRVLVGAVWFFLMCFTKSDKAKCPAQFDKQASKQRNCVTTTTELASTTATAVGLFRIEKGLAPWKVNVN